MKFDEYQEKLNQLKKLVACSNTGSPRELARTLNVSERTARRLVERLKIRNNAIIFCRRSNSYIVQD
jgi:DeoR/GlpR family transcriptional regulator of sugar metabolism